MNAYTRGQHVTFTATLTAKITATGNGGMNAEIESVEVGDRSVGFWTYKGDSELIVMSLSNDMVELAAPENWPPQVGDIWEADGEEYYIRKYTLAEGSVVVENFNGKDDFHRDLDGFKALNPVLVRRRGQ